MHSVGILIQKITDNWFQKDVLSWIKLIQSILLYIKYNFIFSRKTVIL